MNQTTNRKKKKWEDLKENFSDERKWHVEPLQLEISSPAILYMLKEKDVICLGFNIPVHTDAVRAAIGTGGQGS